MPILTLSTGDQASAAAFFDAVQAAIPLDPPISRSSGRFIWDALADSMFGGIDLLGVNELVIVWPEAARVANGNPRVFEIARSVLEDLSAHLSDPEKTGHDPTEVTVLLQMS